VYNKNTVSNFQYPMQHNYRKVSSFSLQGIKTSDEKEQLIETTFIQIFKKLKWNKKRMNLVSNGIDRVLKTDKL